MEIGGQHLLESTQPEKDKSLTALYYLIQAKQNNELEIFRVNHFTEYIKLPCLFGNAENNRTFCFYGHCVYRKS